jgi:SagB-type dehydrogenase family enzyme
MNHPSEIFDSTLKLMSQQQSVAASQATILQKTSQSLAPFYKPIGEINIEQARNRRSSHSYGSLLLSEVAELLHLSMFNTDTEGLRPYPAAGGIYTVNMYLVANQVSQLNSGIHYVRWSDKSLEQIGTAETAKIFLENSVFQPDKESIPLIALLVADTRLSYYKYHDRSIRMAFIEAGGLLQTLYLAGTKLGLSVCALGAISDRAALRLCKLDPSSEVMLACGLAIGGNPSK